MSLLAHYELTMNAEEIISYSWTLNSSLFSRAPCWQNEFVVTEGTQEILFHTHVTGTMQTVACLQTAIRYGNAESS